MKVLVDPGGLGFRIDTIWAYVAVHSDNDEGIVGASMPDGTLMPLIGADEARIKSLRPWAEMAARLSPHPVKLVRFDRRTDIETVEP